MSEQPLISGRGTCWKDKRSPNTYRYYFSLGVKDPKTGRYKRSPTYTVRCKTKTEAKAAMQAKLAEINSSGTITKTKKPTLLASYCWAFHENRDTEALRQRAMKEKRTIAGISKTYSVRFRQLRG